MAAVLLISFVLRWVLAVRGGQYYWSDETRYASAQNALREFLNGNAAEGLRQLFRGADHVFFRVLGLVPAAGERLFWSGSAPSWFAAWFFGLFSTGILFLVWRMVRTTERQEGAAAWACFLAAGCVTGLYYSRHYFPYDASLFFFLLSFYVGLGKTHWARSWLAGCLAGGAYLTYNGYWSIGAVLLIAHSVYRVESTRTLLVRAVSAGAGLVTPVLLVLFICRRVGIDYLAEMAQFSRTVTQGDFGQGFRFVMDFTRESEGLYAALLLMQFLASLTGVDPKAARPRIPGGLWIGIGSLLFGLTVFFSDIVPRFVVYGRTARPIYLFLAMGAGIAVTHFPWSLRRGVRWALAAMALTIAGMNFAQPLRQRFPLDFRIEAQPIVDRESGAAPDVGLGLLNASVFHRPVFAHDIPRYETLLEAKHPLQFRPYVYEGYSREMRDAFAGHDMTMRLVRFTEAQIWQLGSPGLDSLLPNAVGAVRMRLTPPDPVPVGTSEPLLVTGVPGRGDLLCIEYLGTDRARLFLDHWNVGLVRSEPFELRPGSHRVEICMGNLLPDEGSPLMRSFEELKSLRHRVLVEWDGRLVADLPTGLYPAGPRSVRVGENLIGGTTAAANFSGQVRAPTRIDPRAMRGACRATGTAPPDGAVEDGNGGGLRFSFLAEGLSDGIPLLSVRAGERTFSVESQRQSDGFVFSIVLDGTVVGRSEASVLAPGRHSAVLLFPGLNAERESGGRLEQALRKRVGVLRVDSSVIWRADLIGVPAFAAVAPRPDEAKPWIAFGSAWPITGTTARAKELSVRDVRSVELSGATLSRVFAAEAEIGETRPGALSLRFFLPADAAGQQPLVWFGEPGIGDLFFVQFEATRFRIGHDHWGSNPQFTEWLPRTNGPVGLTLGLPPASARDERAVGEADVSVNGIRVASFAARFFPFSERNWVIGWNLAGASTASTYFTGRIQQVQTTP